LKDSGWAHELPSSILVCDLRGIVLEMNSRAAEMYRSFGGMDLIGKSLIECHPEPARSRVVRLLETGETNIYTIEKNGIKKLLYQSPWYRNGSREGMIELAIEIPRELPHFVRK
jgi:hypothetical protein